MKHPILLSNKNKTKRTNMKIQDRMRNRNIRAVSLQAVITFLLLICCLASCSREEDDALSGNDLPSVGSPVSLRIGSVSVTSPDGTDGGGASTRVKDWFYDEGYRLVKVYVFTKNGLFYQCTSHVTGIMLPDGLIYNPDLDYSYVFPQIYIGSTVRIITILIDNPVEPYTPFPDWMPAFPDNPEWGLTEIPMDLRNGNFLVADSGDLDSRSLATYDNGGVECCYYDIDFYYYTSRLQLYCVSATQASVKVDGLALQGSWVLGTETFKVSPGDSRSFVASGLDNSQRNYQPVIPEKGVAVSLTVNEFVYNGINVAHGQVYSIPSRDWDKGKSCLVMIQR